MKRLYCELAITVGVELDVPDDFDTLSSEVLTVAKHALQDSYENGNFEMNLFHQDASVKLISCEEV